MSLIFIDTNVFLNFYRRNTKHYSNLLDTLGKAKRFLFVTEQIPDELKRNKLRIAGDSFSSYRSQMGISNFDLPEHFLPQSSKLSEWNQKRGNLNDDENDLKADFKEHTEEILENISKSEDEVSSVLEDIFENSISPNDDQVKRAKRRHDIGNPPGKTKDPVGDQLSWVQLLDYLESSEDEKLWIITRDEDYYYEYKNELYFNPYLYDDLDDVLTNFEVFIFKRLSKGLNHFQDHEDIDFEELEAGEEMEEIESEEKSFESPATSLRDYYSYPDKCPACGTEDWIGSTPALRGKRPYLTIHIICENCSYAHDTMEPWK
ncbi:PIN domain-containing protein [Salinibacter ruber]|uniref:PIN domain-containing protein n=1 Tax=Salinibacter ruber TaxID=146919 RepID=UPI00216A14FC|nr:PIN domain-containing protein [Salinibacter ruber]MCS3702588.1 hypothetical protein [Salinibacter ruber]